MTASLWTDRVGSLASASCATHCAVLTAAPAFLSTVGLGALAHPSVEWGLFLLAVGIAVCAAVVGHRHHGSRVVLAGFGLGVVVLVAGRLTEALELGEGGSALSIAGGVLMVAAHLANMASASSVDSCK